MKLQRLLYLSLFILSVLAGGSSLVLANNSPADIFIKANDAYYKNHLDEAAVYYQQLLANAKTNGHLYYNLGNVAYRQGHLGEALLNYKKALRLIPRDPDLRANLEFVQRRLVDKFSPAWIDTFFSLLFFWNSFVTLSELELMLAFFLGGMWIFGGILFFSKKSLLRGIFVVFLVMSLLFSASTACKLMQEHRRWGVLLKPEVDVHPTFIETDKILFKLHEGTEVEVEDEKTFNSNGTWVQITLSGGKTGWIKKEEIGEI